MQIIILYYTDITNLILKEIYSLDRDRNYHIINTKYQNIYNWQSTIFVYRFQYTEIKFFKEIITLLLTRNIINMEYYIQKK